MRITNIGMKRFGSVLLSLALLIQFASGARLFDAHEEWSRTCTSNSHHFCDDVSTHDPDHCAICVMSAAGPAPIEIATPELFQITQPVVSLPNVLPRVEHPWHAISSRGPPLLFL